MSNGDWRLRIRQRSKEGYFEAAGELRERLLTGKFPGKIREQFESVLEYFGQNPFIVRSSSFLEDGFGNAFAGKYESVFCVNRGNMAERLEAFENAVRQVYASTMDRSALEYRLRRGLAGKDEQMAILVQRVSGSYYERYYMPCVAGVGYSHSAYQWYPNMDPEAGMLRMVMGLGTKAVDRTREDYPRLSNLDRPEITVYTSAAQKHRFSQRNVDVLDCRENRYKEVRLEQLLDVLPLWYKRMVMEHDYEAERMLSDRGIYRDVWFVSCQRLLENRVFTGLMQRILKTLERVYGTAVDIEYAINMDKDGDFVINLLQCRPLYLGGESEEVKLEGIELKGTLFDVRDASMGTSKKRKVDVIVQIDPAMYGAFPRPGGSAHLHRNSVFLSALQIYPVLARSARSRTAGRALCPNSVMEATCSKTWLRRRCVTAQSLTTGKRRGMIRCSLRTNRTCSDRSARIGQTFSGWSP